MGRAWVGPNARTASDGRTLLNGPADTATRQYRPPEYKPNALGGPKVQANYEWRNQGQRQWQGNAHFDIRK